MFAGIALALSEVSLDLVERSNLRDRIHDRGGELELRFLLRAQGRALPVWLNGQLQVVRWGNRRGQSPNLPFAAWTWQATLQDGIWNEREPVPTFIPATLGLDSGVWFQIREGIKCIVVNDEHGQPVVYPLCEAASHYYKIMTRGSDWMPVLVRELI